MIKKIRIRLLQKMPAGIEPAQSETLTTITFKDLEDLTGAIHRLQAQNQFEVLDQSSILYADFVTVELPELDVHRSFIYLSESIPWDQLHDKLHEINNIFKMVDMLIQEQQSENPENFYYLKKSIPAFLHFLAAYSFLPRLRESVASADTSFFWNHYIDDCENVTDFCERLVEENVLNKIEDSGLRAQIHSLIDPTKAYINAQRYFIFINDDENSDQDFIFKRPDETLESMSDIYGDESLLHS